MVTDSKSGLEAIEITKVFGDLTALDRVSLAVGPGQIHGLVGHNGAGKSTLLRVLAGVVRPVVWPKRMTQSWLSWYRVKKRRFWPLQMM